MCTIRSKRTFPKRIPQEELDTKVHKALTDFGVIKHNQALLTKVMLDEMKASKNKHFKIFDADLLIHSSKAYTTALKIALDFLKNSGMDLTLSVMTAEGLSLEKKSNAVNIEFDSIELQTRYKTPLKTEVNDFIKQLHNQPRRKLTPQPPSVRIPPKQTIQQNSGSLLQSSSIQREPEKSSGISLEMSIPENQEEEQLLPLFSSKRSDKSSYSSSYARPDKPLITEPKIAAPPESSLFDFDTNTTSLLPEIPEEPDEEVMPSQSNLGNMQQSIHFDTESEPYSPIKPDPQKQPFVSEISEREDQIDSSSSLTLGLDSD